MQDIRMRFEMPVNGLPQPPPHNQQQQQQQQSQQTTVFGSNNNSPSSFTQRPMNLYTKTNHNGVILSTSNLIANQNAMNNNSLGINNHKGGGTVGDILLPTKTTSFIAAAASDSNVGGGAADMNSNLIKLKAIANTFVPNSPTSSEEDNSPTEMNNCRRMMEKPPLVKRLAMGLLMKTAEDSRPLVYNTHNHSQFNKNTSGGYNNVNNNNNNCPPGSSAPVKGIPNCDGYTNEGVCDRDRVVSNKFGDSCRQSLMALHQQQLDNNNQNHEFNYKKNLLRETSSANSSPKLFPNMFKARDQLTPQEQQELKGAAWFQAGIPREISLEVLTKQNPGAFIVRQSSKPGCFALSLRVPPPSPKVAHYLILRTPKGYKIKGFTKEFTSLRALITHHSVMPELLPVPLCLPRPQNIVPHPRELDDLDSYSSLTDYRKMMADLNV